MKPLYCILAVFLLLGTVHSESPPNHQHPGCLEDMKVGPCRGAKQRYYFDHMSETCQQFSWGGCKPNGNNFQTEAECKAKCECALAPDTGLPDDDMIPVLRYYYEPSGHDTGECKVFQYFGDRLCGNANRFRYKHQCEQTCKQPCQQPKKVGPCRMALPRFYYNQASGQCEKFTYGGCGGNDNNFKNKADCEAACP